AEVRRPRPAPWDVKMESSEEEEFDWSPSDAHSPPQVDAAATAADIIQRIKQDLVENMDAPEKKRKQIMRDYLKRWHPDKNDEESKGTATAVTHFLYANKAPLLRPDPVR
ncbi:unnamed protein product, partial [Durusdinium trenchii]